MQLQTSETQNSAVRESEAPPSSYLNQGVYSQGGKAITAETRKRKQMDTEKIKQFRL
jgi:hypothetical protein